jgi:hypothetical protein
MCPSTGCTFQWKSTVDFVTLETVTQLLQRRVYVRSLQTCHTALSLRLFVPNSLTGITVSCFPRCPPATLLMFLSSYGCSSPTATAAPSLRPLVLSGSFMRCEPFQFFFLWGDKTSKSSWHLHAHLSSAVKLVITFCPIRRGPDVPKSSVIIFP